MGVLNYIEKLLLISGFRFCQVVCCKCLNINGTRKLQKKLKKELTVKTGCARMVT